MKKCLIIENSYKKEASIIGRQITEVLTSMGVSVSEFVLAQQASVPDTKDVPFDDNDFVITLGGDGTVLFAARGCAPLGIPVFPVNLGQFGFIAGVQKASWKQSLEQFLHGNLEPIGRDMIQVDISRHGENIFSSNGLNDLILTSLLPARMVYFEIVYNKSQLGTFKSDGLIVATATGSTAYSVSAGGPIVDPELDAFVLASVNSFSLSARPLVFNPDGKLSVTVMPGRNTSVSAVVDGQKSINLTVGDKVVITKSEYKALLLSCTIDNFYEALRSKLNWAGGPHA